MSSSTLWSVSVTRSTGELFSITLMSFWSASRITWQKQAAFTADCICYLHGLPHILCLLATDSIFGNNEANMMEVTALGLFLQLTEHHSNSLLTIGYI